MAVRYGFWAGAALGALAGVAGGCAWRGKRGAGSRRAIAPQNFALRRDAPESAGDPARLTPLRGDVPTGFSRQGGAPGGSSDAESLEVPGRPGQQVPASISEPVRPATRTVNLDKARGR